MATDAEVKKWLSTQKYTADQEITPFQRLRSKYLPPRGVKTWGEWYDQYDITPPTKEKEAPATNRRKEIRRIEDAIDQAFQDVETYQVDMNFSTPGSAEYNRAKENRDKAQAELERLRAERNLILATEEEKKTQEDLRKEKEKRQRDADAGKSTESSDKKIRDLENKGDTVRRAITNLEQESGRPAAAPAAPSFGPPEVRQGRPVPGTGGGLPTPTGPTRPTQPTGPIQPTQPTGPGRGGDQRPPAGGGGGGGGRQDQREEEVPAETFESVLEAAKSKYGGIDEVFRTDKDLRKLLRRAIGDVDDATDDYTKERFLSELENTTWWKENAGPIRQRGFYKRQYDDLVNALKTDDPNYQTALAELNRTSEYGRGLSSTIDIVKNRARTLGVQMDDATATIVAKNLYDYANEENEIKIREAVLGSGKFGVGGLYTGAAGNNIRILREVAAANGLDFDKQYGTSIDTWLAKIAQGESIETYKDLIRKQAAVSWTVDDRTRALLDQGVDLETIYSPFKKTMATILEIPEEKVTLYDLSRKGVFGGEKPMNLYDFRKALRQDERWQYTENARTEMSNLTENLLRDFGFVR